MLHTYHPVLHDYHKTSISTRVAPHVVATRANIMVDLPIQSLSARTSLHRLHLLSPEHCRLEPEQCQCRPNEEISKIFCVYH
jgi:hypothetical protein